VLAHTKNISGELNPQAKWEVSYILLGDFSF
jgi:hypothetical protein